MRPLPHRSPSNSPHSSKTQSAYNLSQRWQRSLLLLVPVILVVNSVLLQRSCWTFLGFADVDNNLVDYQILSNSPPSLPSKALPFLSQNQTLEATKTSQRRDARTSSSFGIVLKTIQRSLVETFLSEELQVDSNNQSLIQIRAFSRLNTSVPCFAPEVAWKQYKTQVQPAHVGILFVKTSDITSRIIAGVTIRVAMNAATSHNRIYNTTFETCKVRYESYPARYLEYGKRAKSRSFLFSFLREPTDRAVDMFFHHHVSRKKKEPSDVNFKRYLTRSPEQGAFLASAWPYDHYMHYLSPDGFEIGSGSQGVDFLTANVNKILKAYDFIGIAERLDESLVAMQMILGLKTSEILYNQAEVDQSWDEKGFYIQPSFVSGGMANFFASDKWRELSMGDYLLYLAANASLDRTIDSLGRTEFNAKLALFRRAKELVAAECGTILTRYSAGGTIYKTDCLHGNAGCGSRCFDRLAREYNI